MNIFDRFRRPPSERFVAAPPAGIVAGYDLDSGQVAIPEHLRVVPGLSAAQRRARIRERQLWMDANGLVPAVVGGIGYGSSFCQMLEPFVVADAVAVTAAAETILTQTSLMTMAPNFFAYPGKAVWFRTAGKQSNVITTPGTYTWKCRYGVNGTTADTLLQTSGAITPESVAGRTDMMWYTDLFIKALATGGTTTALTLLAYGEVFFANSLATAADIRAAGMPPGQTALANVASLNGTVGNALNMFVTPTVATGSITCRDAWVLALN